MAHRTACAADASAGGMPLLLSAGDQAEEQQAIPARAGSGPRHRTQRSISTQRPRTASDQVFSCSHGLNLRFFRSMGDFAFGSFPGITVDFLADDSFGSLIQVLTKRLTKFHVLRP
jgi:hypothetical protein